MKKGDILLAPLCVLIVLVNVTDSIPFRVPEERKGKTQNLSLRGSGCQVYTPPRRKRRGTRCEKEEA